MNQRSSAYETDDLTTCLPRYLLEPHNDSVTFCTHGTKENCAGLRKSPLSASAESDSHADYQALFLTPSECSQTYG